MTSTERRRMDKGAIVIDIYNQMCNDGEINKDLIVSYLAEEYASDSYIPEGFDKIQEMGQMLSLVERIKEVGRDAGPDFSKRYESDKDVIKAVIYSVALIEGRKHKFDIFKIKDDFEIDKLITKYEIKEENANED